VRILVAFDGSEDGFEGLRTIADLLRLSGASHDITLAIVAWPARPSPIWDQAAELQILDDDLHRAVADVVGMHLKRMSELFAPIGTVRIEYLEGDPVVELLALERRSRAQLVVVGQTRGKRAREVNEKVLRFIESSSVRTLLAFG
jgi:nucleotide-binding universal stress UspA family protein